MKLYVTLIIVKVRAVKKIYLLIVLIRNSFKTNLCNWITGFQIGLYYEYHLFYNEKLKKKISIRKWKITDSPYYGCVQCEGKGGV